MQRADWLALVAVHCDSWLMAVAVFNAARLNSNGRHQLFNGETCTAHTGVVWCGVVWGKGGIAAAHHPCQWLRPCHLPPFLCPPPTPHLSAEINSLPTCYEVVTGAARPSPDANRQRTANGGEAGGAQEEASTQCPNCGRLYVDGE